MNENTLESNGSLFVFDMKIAGYCLFFFGMHIMNLHAAIPEDLTNTESVEAAVTAYKTIGDLRKQSPIDADAIAQNYAGALQNLTKEVDEANNLGLDRDVLEAINEIKLGHEPALAAQVVDKTLQRVFYQIIWNRISMIRDEFEIASSAALTSLLDNAEAAFQAISGTVAREIQVLSADRQTLITGANPGLDTVVNSAFARVRTAVSKGNAAEDASVIAVERYEIRLSLTQAYYNAVLREIAGVMEHRDSDAEETRKEQKEAEIFYRVIEPLIVRGNPAGNAFIKSRLIGNAADIRADEIVSEMSKGLIPRVEAELNGQAGAIGENRVQAMAEAAGALYFAKIFLPDLELRQGANVRADLDSAMSRLQTASSDNSVSASEEARQSIQAILDNYETGLYLAQYSTNTDVAFINNAVSSYQVIGELRGQAVVDANAIAAEYKGDLQQLVQLVDQVYGLSTDQAILTAIKQISASNQVNLAAQTIDKSLQRTFALVVYNRTTLVAEQSGNLSASAVMLEWDRAYAAYLALANTAAKGNIVLSDDRQALENGTDPDLDYQITLAFAQGKDAFGKTPVDGSSVASARANITVPLIRSFLNAALGELGELITDRDTDRDEAKEKQLKADLYYRIIESFVAQDNPSGNDLVKAQLTGDVSGVVAKDIINAISKGVIGQVNRYIGQIESSFEVDKNQAVLAAENATLFTGILLPDLELRLSVLQRVQLENALRDLKEGCLTDNSARALSARAIILDIFSAYQTTLI